MSQEQNSESTLEFIINNFKFLVSYTAILISATWAVFTFSLGERVSIANEKLDAAQTKIAQYEEKLKALDTQPKNLNSAENNKKEEIDKKEDSDKKEGNDLLEPKTLKLNQFTVDSATGLKLAYVEYNDRMGRASIKFIYSDGNYESSSMRVGDTKNFSADGESYSFIVTEVSEQEIKYIIQKNTQK